MRARALGTAAAGLLMAMAFSACGDDAGIVEGAPAPAFSLPSADGKTVSLADYGDGLVLLFFHMADG